MLHNAVNDESQRSLNSESCPAFSAKQCFNPALSGCATATVYLQSIYLLLRSPGLLIVVCKGIVRVTTDLLAPEVKYVWNGAAGQCDECEQRARPLVAEAMVHL